MEQRCKCTNKGMTTHWYYRFRHKMLALQRLASWWQHFMLAALQLVSGVYVTHKHARKAACLCVFAKRLVGGIMFKNGFIQCCKWFAPRVPTDHVPQTTGKVRCQSSNHVVVFSQGTGNEMRVNAVSVYPQTKDCTPQRTRKLPSCTFHYRSVHNPVFFQKRAQRHFTPDFVGLMTLFIFASRT